MNKTNMSTSQSSLSLSPSSSGEVAVVEYQVVPAVQHNCQAFKPGHFLALGVPQPAKSESELAPGLWYVGGEIPFTLIMPGEDGGNPLFTGVVFKDAAIYNFCCLGDAIKTTPASLIGPETMINISKRNTLYTGNVKGKDSHLKI